MGWENSAVDEIIAEEYWNEDCLSVSWSPSGMCPCCGVELGLMDVSNPFPTGGQFQLCNSCGWESEETYDA